MNLENNDPNICANKFESEILLVALSDAFSKPLPNI